ncbi:MAG: response regulator [Deltaproteobacteria bacterium]|nr:response regulator [Deltaproteobacteria bacterium]
MKPVILFFGEHDKSRIALWKSLTATLPKYHILRARDLKEALAIIHSQSLDIVLIQIEMLHKECCRHIIRKIKYAAQGAQIFVIADHEDEVYQTENAVEVSGYILKDGLTSFLKRMLPSLVGFPSVSDKKVYLHEV